MQAKLLSTPDPHEVERAIDLHLPKPQRVPCGDVVFRLSEITSACRVDMSIQLGFKNGVAVDVLYDPILWKTLLTTITDE